jgi:hypothetical protein
MRISYMNFTLMLVEQCLKRRTFEIRICCFHRGMTSIANRFNAHLLYEPGYTTPCVGNLTEEKSPIIIF